MKFKKDILIIITLLFIFSLAWIGESAYKIIKTSTISDGINQHISPIDPKLDTATIDNLKSREQINPTYDLHGNVSTAPASPSATPIASQAGNILP